MCGSPAVVFPCWRTTRGEGAGPRPWIFPAGALDLAPYADPSLRAGHAMGRTVAMVPAQAAVQELRAADNFSR